MVLNLAKGILSGYLSSTAVGIKSKKAHPIVLSLDNNDLGKGRWEIES